MQPLLTPKRRIDEPNLKYGICVWQLPDGTYVMDTDGNYLSAGPMLIGNLKVEKRMTEAARQCGITEGRPFWLPGFRKISDNEHDDQMARLLDGGIPDVVDEYRQSRYGNVES